MKLFTNIEIRELATSLSLKDRIMVLGSCFADNIGEKLANAGYNVCINPFGTLYNPASIASAVARLECGESFTKEDCVMMGAGADLVCSFSHHTKFARKTESEFLKDANAALREASDFWKDCTKVIVTFGTARVWKHDGKVVSNCLKRPASEFTGEILSMEEIEACLDGMEKPDKEYIFTVSPIRHLSDGAHANTVSKATLLLALDKWLENHGHSYFPAYEIMMDELRDYRFYAEDLCHPNHTAIELIWEKFLKAATLDSEATAIRKNEKDSIRNSHRKILQK